MSTVLFVILFYHESVGFNAVLLGILYALLYFYDTHKINRTGNFYILITGTIASCFAFAFFGDLISFIALLWSLILLFYYSRKGKLKIILALPLFIINMFTFLWKFFSFKEWYSSIKKTGMTQKIISTVVVPASQFVVFFAIYAMGSDHFTNFFAQIDLNPDVRQIFCLAVILFAVTFTFWHLKIYSFFTRWNAALKNELTEAETK